VGCDIHLYVERKVDDKWVTADKWTPDPYADEGEESRLIVDYIDCFYSERNYDLFAMLADVRNERSFAGCVTGSGFKPISTPRGLPDDISPEVKRESDELGLGFHSHSWLTLTELNAYDWNQVATHIGVVDVLGFAQFEQHDQSYAYYLDGAPGEKVKYISNEEMRAEVAKYQPEIGELASRPDDQGTDWLEFRNKLLAEPVHYYTRVSWQSSYAVSAGAFLEETMPKLEALSYGKPENVRIVFWFDN
jgi:hypothetical protein